MNESTDRATSPRPEVKNVAALTSVYGGGSPLKKSKPPLSPMERTLSENRRGGFSSPPARKQKVFKSPVKAAPVESSDDSDSDDDAKTPKPPKPGSFEDSFNKLMASSSSYDEVESDSDSDDSNAKGDKKKGEKVRSTTVKSTSTEPNAYSSSERGMSTSDDDDDDDSSSSSGSSDSDDSSSSDDSDVSSDSATSTEDGKSKHEEADIHSQSERHEEDDVAPLKATSPKAAELQNRPVVDRDFEVHEENLKSEDDMSKNARPANDNTTHSAWSQYTNDTVPLGDVEEDEVLQQRELQESQKEEASPEEQVITQNGEDQTKGDDHTRALLVTSLGGEHPEDEEPSVPASEDMAQLHSIDGMENMEVYQDTDSDDEEKSRLSHDTPFVAKTASRDSSNSDQDLDLAGMKEDDHRVVQVEDANKSLPADDQEIDLAQQHGPQEEQELSGAKVLGDDDHDEEQGSAGESELSDEMEEDEEDDEKRTRRRRCMLIMCCLACILLLAIAYIFVWVFVIHKNNSSSTQPDVKQLVGELYGEVAMSQLGSAVAVSGDGLTVAAGAPGYQGTSTASVGIGQVRVLSRQGPTLSQWAQIGQLLQGDNENDAFGSSVALSGDGTMLAVGAAKRDSIGYVRVFNLTANNEWSQASNDIMANQSLSGFGASLAVSANGLVVAVGAPNHLDSVNSIRNGEVRVYGLFNKAWRLLGEPLSGQANGDGFGTSVSLSADGRTLAVGSPGNSLAANASGLVQAFLYDIPGNFWQQMGSNIMGDQALDRLGVSVSLSSDGQTLAAGMVTNDSRGGMVRAYHLGSDSTWSQVGNGVTGEQPYSQWGYSVALSNDGSRVVAGAPLETTVNGERSGGVRVFDISDGNWQEVGNVLSGKDAGDNFGLAVSISGDGQIIFAGAPNYTNTFYRPNGAQLLPEAGYAQVYDIGN
jgi:hypothetical protein